jgi:glutathione synthase/RimK-type ligase-like ATP-grasp enzyme
MILLWGLPEDDPLDAVYQALQRCCGAVLFVDQYEVMNSSLTLRVDAHAEGVLRVGSQEVRLEDISAAYIRPYDSAGLSRGRAAHPRSSQFRHAMEFDACLRAWLDVTPALVVNPMRAMAGNNSKPFQAAQIEAMGLGVPDTIVTTDPKEALRFWGRYGTVVYKSTSGVRSIVSRLSPSQRERLRDIQWCPTQFQQYVHGTDVRVHVVGDMVFGCEVLSEADDYRYAGRHGLSVEIRPYDVPLDCARLCLKLSQSMGLLVAGIDLRRTPDDRWYCFEVNPSPGFTYFQERTQQPIDEAIANLLMGIPS